VGKEESKGKEDEQLFVPGSSAMLPEGERFDRRLEKELHRSAVTRVRIALFAVPEFVESAGREKVRK
jgi:hypothetical protein